MLQSICIYTFFITTLILFSIKYSKKNYKKIELSNPYIVTIIGLYTIICAIRFNVGVDYISYLEEYLSSRLYTSYDWSSYEYGWAWFTWILSRNDIHYTFYFGIVAFVQIVLLLKVFNDKVKLLPYIIISFFIGGYFIGFQNVIRQNIVMCIFMYLVMHRRTYIWEYIIVALLCTAIHKSSILIILLYPLVVYHPLLKLENSFLRITIFLLCIYIGYFYDLFSSLTSNISIINIITKSDYNNYLHGDYLSMGMGRSMGLGFFLKAFTDLIIISMAKRMSSYYSHDECYSICFYLYFIGTCLHYLVPTSMILGRPILYLTIFTLPVLAFYINFTLNIPKRNVSMFLGNMFVVFVICLLFVVNHIITPEGNMAEYHFFWEY